MSHLYKEARECSGCGYRTFNRSNWCSHVKRCAHHRQEDTTQAQLKDRVQSLEQQLAVKDQQLAESAHQLAARDEQIQELLRAAREERKRPRVQKNNIQIDNVQVVVYGQEVESIELRQQMAEMIKDPESSVAQYIVQRARDPSNRNIIVPNSREPFVKVLREEGWQVHPKGEVLPEIVQDAACKLSAHADEESATGRRYLMWHDRLLTSVDQRGQLCKEQEARVFKALAFSTRD